MAYKNDCYRVPNASSAVVKPKMEIVKNQKSPKKTKGGDLRAK